MYVVIVGDVDIGFGNWVDFIVFVVVINVEICIEYVVL